MDPLFLGASVATPLTFSGHETFALRSTWLKKAFDVLLDTPDLFLPRRCICSSGSRQEYGAVNPLLGTGLRGV